MIITNTEYFVTTTASKCQHHQQHATWVRGGSFGDDVARTLYQTKHDG